MRGANEHDTRQPAKDARRLFVLRRGRDDTIRAEELPQLTDQEQAAVDGLDDAFVERLVAIQLAASHQDGS